ncbi:hypothetical protein F4692_001146 [Nocardioides cavernae]|uniref:WD40 repeat domain-containing protein n=1 Tax=Nocardioides cavernae TaxID=1921566 RepID=A0A7Y9KS45_9ACTN|nr:WD40 repeat domain-containing protein [Nocardioides cavernae]NYE36042.1 hypothetical protein [Nocardioides cavernae]
MTDLRTSLRRVADAVEPLPVADDLWHRAQAARRRGQVLAAAAVLAIIASVTWSAVLLGTDDREARTASQEVPGGAIPSRIEDPGDLPATDDLAVGRASVAFVNRDGDPVVLTATDGVPHRLALPDWDRSRRALALTPDGTALAYQRTRGEDTVLVRVDLGSGRERVLFSQPGDSLTYDSLAWSSDGTRLSWSASTFGDVPAVGVVEPLLSRSRIVALPYTPTNAVVAPDGTLAISAANGALRLDSRQGGSTRIETQRSAVVAGFSPDGRYVALATGPASASYTLDVRRRVVVEHPFPEGTLGESVVRPVGWLDDRLQLLVVQALDGSGAELVVTTPEVDDTSTWRRSVGSVGGPGVANSLSVAVDLVPDLDGTSSQQLTHDFGEPVAVGQRDISWMIGLGVAAAIALGMALRWLWRRLLG